MLKRQTVTLYLSPVKFFSFVLHCNPSRVVHHPSANLQACIRALKKYYQDNQILAYLTFSRVKRRTVCSTPSPYLGGTSPLHHPRAPPKSLNATKIAIKITRTINWNLSPAKFFWLVLPLLPPRMVHHSSITPGVPLTAPKKQKVQPRSC